MMHLTISDGQRFRIALALLALGHKPPTQSITSFILDLHARFPSRTAPSRQQDPWRDKFIELETELAATKQKLIDRDAELALLRARELTPSGSAGVPNPNPTISAPKKKKRKVTAEHVNGIPDAACTITKPTSAKISIDAVVAGMELDIPQLSLDTSFDILSAYLKFKSLSSPGQAAGKGNASISPDLVIAAAINLVDACSRLLGILLTRPATLASAARPRDILDIVDTSLSTALASICTLNPPRSTKRDTSVHTNTMKTKKTKAATRKAHCARLYCILTSDIIPLILGSFIQLSTDIATSRLQYAEPQASQARSRQPQDVRPDMLSMLRSVLATLRNAAPHCGHVDSFASIEDYVALATAREIAKLWPLPPPPLPPPPPPSGSCTTAGWRAAGQTQRTHAALESAEAGACAPSDADTRRSGGGTADGALEADGRRAARGPPRTRASRVGRLARKDAVWYLCACLHDVSPALSRCLSPDGGGGVDGLVPVRAQEVLGGLLARCMCVDGGRGRDDDGMSEMERGMLLSVLERGWFGTVQR